MESTELKLTLDTSVKTAILAIPCFTGIVLTASELALIHEYVYNKCVTLGQHALHPRTVKLLLNIICPRRSEQQTTLYESAIAREVMRSLVRVERTVVSRLACKVPDCELFKNFNLTGLALDTSDKSKDDKVEQVFCQTAPGNCVSVKSMLAKLEPAWSKQQPPLKVLNSLLEIYSEEDTGLLLEHPTYTWELEADKARGLDQREWHSDAIDLDSEIHLGPLVMDLIDTYRQQGERLCTAIVAVDAETYEYRGHIYAWPSRVTPGDAMAIGIRSSITNLVLHETPRIAPRIILGVAEWARAQCFARIEIQQPFAVMHRILTETLGFVESDEGVISSTEALLARQPGQVEFLQQYTNPLLLKLAGLVDTEAFQHDVESLHKRVDLKYREVFKTVPCFTSGLLPSVPSWHRVLNEDHVPLRVQDRRDIERVLRGALTHNPEKLLGKRVPELMAEYLNYGIHAAAMTVEQDKVKAVVS